MDLAVRTLMVDNSMTVEELVGVICKRINIPIDNDFSMAFERPKEEKSDLDDDEKRIRDKMTTLREKAKLHTEDEGDLASLDHDNPVPYSKLVSAPTDPTRPRGHGGGNSPHEEEVLQQRGQHD